MKKNLAEEATRKALKVIKSIYGNEGEKGNIKQCLKIKRIEIVNLCFSTFI